MIAIVNGKGLTINAAEIIGAGDRVGSLEAGKDAGGGVFAGHPFDYRTVADLDLVDGRVACRRGRKDESPWL
jgi:imidazolonepropionase-like amidohydrolase